MFVRHRDDDAQEHCPAEDFLDNTCPESVKDNLVAIIDAVAESPPPQFSGGGMWEAMHGEMAGFYEARTRGPNKLLYRLFCILEQDGPGLRGPAIVVIDGLVKPVRTVARAADYERVKRLGDEYRRRIPRNAF